MILGLYKHYKGGWYIGICKVQESTNNLARREKVLYFSLRNKEFNVRLSEEFFGMVPLKPGWEEFRFLKFTFFKEPCYCRELGAYEPCPRHGAPKYGNHMKLKRYDGHEHERKLS